MLRTIVSPIKPKIPKWDVMNPIRCWLVPHLTVVLVLPLYQVVVE